MMLNCKEVSRKVASDHLATAGPWERFRIRFHLFMCRHCRCYDEQLREIDSTAQELWNDPSQDRASIDRLQREVLETLKEGGPQDQA
ncbi:MAG: hypothetical protein V3R94_07345 [Acidobacteriota bacterium]